MVSINLVADLYTLNILSVKEILYLLWRVIHFGNTYVSITSLNEEKKSPSRYRATLNFFDTTDIACCRNSINLPSENTLICSWMCWMIFQTMTVEKSISSYRRSTHLHAYQNQIKTIILLELLSVKVKLNLMFLKVYSSTLLWKFCNCPLLQILGSDISHKGLIDTVGMYIGLWIILKRNSVEVTLKHV